MSTTLHSQNATKHVNHVKGLCELAKVFNANFVHNEHLPMDDNGEEEKAAVDEEKYWLLFFSKLCPLLTMSSTDTNLQSNKNQASTELGHGIYNNDKLKFGNEITRCFGNSELKQTTHAGISSSMLSRGYALVDCGLNSIKSKTTNTQEAFVSDPLSSTTGKIPKNTNYEAKTTTAYYHSLVTKLAKSIDALRKEKWPATFIMLFDETWELANMAEETIRKSTSEKNVLNYDILAWHIDSSVGDVGFSPHRDRQPIDVASSFHSRKEQNMIEKVQVEKKEESTIFSVREKSSTTKNMKSENNNTPLQDDGMGSFGHAKYVTLWLALTDATPENSCLYVIPKKHDPGYFSGDIDEIDPLRRALQTKESYQNIRSLPRQSGQSVIFTHRLVHWGSRGSADCAKPRIAISFVSSDPSYEKPYIKNNNSKTSEVANTPYYIPPFHLRMLLSCAQLLIYHQRFNLSTSIIRACYNYCKEHGDLLEPSYRKKVFYEFVCAMKDARCDTNEEDTGITNSFKAEKNDGTIAFVESSNCDEDDEEKMLEEMLDAEAEGYGDFEDDYDEIKSGSGSESSGDILFNSNDNLSKEGKKDFDLTDKIKIQYKARDEDDEEKMLEEMLDAEAEGYGDFEDDYDEIKSGCGSESSGGILFNSNNHCLSEEGKEDIDAGAYKIRTARKRKIVTTNATELTECKKTF